MTLFYNYNLVLHMIETNNNFSQIIRQYYIDFSQMKPILLDSMPEDRSFLRIRVRASVIRDVLYSWLFLELCF